MSDDKNFGSNVVNMRKNLRAGQKNPQHEQEPMSINREEKYHTQAQGHEKILAGCKKHGTLMRLIMRDKSAFDGTITQFDRWTITVKDDHGDRFTFFKHDLSSFHAII